MGDDLAWDNGQGLASWRVESSYSRVAALDPRRGAARADQGFVLLILRLDP